MLGLCVVLGAGERAVSEIFRVPHMALPCWCGATIKQRNKIMVGGGACYEGRKQVCDEEGMGAI